LQLPRSVPDAERHVVRRRVPPRQRAPPHRHLPPRGAEMGGARAGEPVGVAVVRVADAVAAAQAQLRRPADVRPRAVRLLRRGQMMAAPRLAEQYEDLAKQGHAARLGMWTFLASEMLLFAG